MESCFVNFQTILPIYKVEEPTQHRKEENEMFGMSVAMCAIAQGSGLSGPKKANRTPIRGSTGKDRKVKPVAESQKDRSIDYKA